MKKRAFGCEDGLKNHSKQAPVTEAVSQADDKESMFSRLQERVQLSRILDIPETEVTLNASYWEIESSEDDSADEVVVNIGDWKAQLKDQVNGELKKGEEVKESRALHITNLVRPFTLGQLTTLLSRTGTFDREKGFWIDHIRSHCYVIYHSAEMARQTLQALHNRQWPDSSPKRLNVQFVLEDSNRVRLLLKPLNNCIQKQQTIVEESRRCTEEEEAALSCSSSSPPPNASFTSLVACHKSTVTVAAADHRCWSHDPLEQSRKRHLSPEAGPVRRLRRRFW